jgi:transcriptional regulator with XRE-family HTH domain
MHNDATDVGAYRLAPGETGTPRQMLSYRAAVVAYLKRVERESGLSLNELAGRVSVSHTTLTRPVNNPDYKYTPKFAVLQRIALATGIPLPDELTTADRKQPIEPRLGTLPVRGVVAAGMWQAMEAVQDETLGFAPMVETPRFAGIRQWAELVRGASMNRTYRDGDFLHVVDAVEISYRPIVGNDVIVERRQHQGGTVERTCKRIAAGLKGSMVLVGDSTVETWNQPLPMAGSADTEVAIVGLVIGSYRSSLS